MIENPFVPGAPLSGDSPMFKGRRYVIHEIKRLALGNAHPFLFIDGERAIGKTSLLLNLPSFLPEGVISFYLNLSSASALSSDVNYCHSLVRTFIYEGGRQGIYLPAEPSRQEFMQDPFWTLERWMDDAFSPRGALSGARVLLLLDDAYQLGAKLKSGNISCAVTSHLRSLPCGDKKVSVLLSGCPWGSPLEGISAPLKIEEMEEDAATSVLVSPVKGFNLSYASGIVDKILYRTHCHPHLLQLMGWSIFEAACDTETTFCDERILEVATAEALFTGSSYFLSHWKHSVSPHATPASRFPGEGFLTALAHGKNFEVRDPYLSLAITWMVRQKLIEAVGTGYQIRIPLMSQWIRGYLPKAKPTNS